MGISRTTLSKLILASGLLWATSANTQTSTTAMSLVGNPTGLSFFIAGTEASGTTQATLPSIFGGYAGSTGTCATSPSQDATCNSCVGNLDPCNQNSIHPGLFLSITLVSNTAATFQQTPKMMWKFSDASGLSDVNNPSAVTLAPGTPFTALIKWSTLCSAAGSGSSCTQPFGPKTLNVGIDNNSDGAFEEKVDFTIVFGYADPANKEFTYCPTAAARAEDGICDYTMTPGDEKVYISDYAAASNDLVTDNSAIKFNRIILFYNEGVGSVAGITNNSPNFIVDVRSNSPAEPSISDPRLTGLQNETQYCFLLANMDQVGNISKYAPAALTNDANKVCATPSVVVGLLDDKRCFIATATFGSSMAEEVQTFRRFRNEVLAKTNWGRTFIEKYYKYGPEAAEWISHSPTLKSLSIAALWPLLLFVKLSLWLGAIPASLIVLVMGAVFAKLWRRSRNLKGAM